MKRLRNRALCRSQVTASRHPPPPAYCRWRPQRQSCLRVGGTGEDALIAAFIGAAVDPASASRSPGAASWPRRGSWQLTASPAKSRCHGPRCRRCRRCNTKGAGGATQALAASVYELAGGGRFVWCQAKKHNPPCAVDRVRCGSATAGYNAGNEAAQQGAVPYGIKAWLLLTIGALRESRAYRPVCQWPRCLTASLIRCLTGSRCILMQTGTLSSASLQKARRAVDGLASPCPAASMMWLPCGPPSAPLGSSERLAASQMQNGQAPSSRFAAASIAAATGAWRIVYGAHLRHRRPAPPRCEAGRWLVFGCVEVA